MSAEKKIDQSAMIGDGGIALIHQATNSMGHVWHERSIDAGIDGMIELRDPTTGVVSNRHILVQSKASNGTFPGENDATFYYLCDERDIDYWMKADQQPVILVCSHPNTGESWWAHVQSYFADVAQRASRRIDFNKATQRFDGEASDRLLSLADPHGRAHTPSPEAREETLVSNLLPVEFPSTVYAYRTPSGTTLKDAYNAQRASGLEIRHDFILFDGQLWTWARTEGTALGALAASPTEKRNLLDIHPPEAGDHRIIVRMLLAALRQDLRRDCNFHVGRRMLYFQATPDLAPRSVSTSRNQSRLVFKKYPKKSDPTSIAFCKHSGLRPRFIQIDEGWHCQITPDYFYSYDGRHESRFTPNYLRTIKMRERNSAVLQETRMWATYLQRDHGGVGSKILQFLPLATFTVDRGINDKDWKPNSLPESQDDTQQTTDAVEL